MIIKASVTLDINDSEKLELSRLLKSTRIYYNQAQSFLINELEGGDTLMTLDELKRKMYTFKQYISPKHSLIKTQYIDNAINLAYKKFYDLLMRNEKIEVKNLTHFKMIKDFEFDFKNNTLILPDRRLKFIPNQRYNPNDPCVNIGLTIRSVIGKMTASMQSKTFEEEEEIVKNNLKKLYTF